MGSFSLGHGAEEKLRGTGESQGWDKGMVEAKGEEQPLGQVEGDKWPRLKGQAQGGQLSHGVKSLVMAKRWVEGPVMG